MKWTPEEKAILKKLSEAGKRIDDAIKVFPYRTRASIEKMATALKLSFAGPKPKIDMDAFARIMKGETKCL